VGLLYQASLDCFDGFARARCDDCGHDFLIAFSCKGRGIHVCVLDGIFEPDPEQGARFIEAEELDADDAEEYPAGDALAQPEPEYEYDQRMSW
jgi:hypothetical protein